MEEPIRPHPAHHGDDPIARCLNGRGIAPPPIWLMRQAGRHLPEYHSLRERAGGFDTLCRTPDLAAEATLQPVERYDVDAAIVFSDILFLLEAFGCRVSFEGQAGPKISSRPDLGRETDLPMEHVMRATAPVVTAIAATRARLAANKALIGFAGGPFTLAVYALSGTGDPIPAVRAHYESPRAFSGFLDRLAAVVAHSLEAQHGSGADALMLFDSWAGGLDPVTFDKLIAGPNARVATLLRDRGVRAPLIGFPRGAGVMLPDYCRRTCIGCVGLDTAADLDWVDKNLPQGVAVQGNLDPLRLLAGGQALREGVDRIKRCTLTRPLIFNLGHGVHPGTPIAHVEQLVEQVRNG